MSGPTEPSTPLARFGGRLATGLRDVTSDPAALDSTGYWAVAYDFEGRLTCARFDDVRPAPAPPSGAGWRGPGAATGTAPWTAPPTPRAYAASVNT